MARNPQTMSATGHDPLFTTRLPRDMIDQIEIWAEKHELPRSAGVRELIDLGLAAKPKGKK